MTSLAVIPIIMFVSLSACSGDVACGEGEYENDGVCVADAGSDPDVGTDGDWTGVSRTVEEVSAELMTDSNFVEVLTHSDEIAMTLQGDSGSYSNQAVTTYISDNGGGECTMTRTEFWTGPVTLVDAGEGAFEATLDLLIVGEAVCETDPQLGFSGEIDVQVVVDCTLSADANSISCSNADGHWTFTRNK